MKAIEEVEKHAREKRMPERGLDDMIRRLRAEHEDGYIDDMLYHELCAYIDKQAVFWEGMRGFLERRREERTGGAKKEGER